MEEEEKKESGLTISEIEQKIRKFGIEATLTAAFILSAIFALIWGGGMMTWSILLASLGGIVGAILAKIVHRGMDYILGFFTKERITSIVVAVLILLISIFLPVIIFAIIGLAAGQALALAGYKAFGRDILQ